MNSHFEMTSDVEGATDIWWLWIKSEVWSSDSLFIVFPSLDKYEEIRLLQTAVEELVADIWQYCQSAASIQCCFVASVQLRRAQSEQLVIHLQTTLRVAEFKTFRKVMLSQYRAGAWMHRKQAWPPQHLEPYPSHVCLSLISLQAMCHSSLLLIMPTRLWPAWRLPTNHD